MIAYLCASDIKRVMCSMYIREYVLHVLYVCNYELRALFISLLAVIY